MVRILSIQSHVTYGYVGNRAAVFPLQLLGYDVDVINTVSFSNHTGYPTVAGTKLSPSDFNALVDGLRSNSLDTTYTHILTGYIGAPSLLQAVLDFVRRMKMMYPEVTYVCDPVCGDEGKLYVSPECVPLLRELLSLADIVRLNNFELQVLSGLLDKIDSLEVLNSALDLLHQKAPHHVQTLLVSTTTKQTNDFLDVVVSTVTGARYRVQTPRLPCYFTGAGDLFTALFLGYVLKHSSVVRAAERAVSALFSVCEETFGHYQKEKTDSCSVSQDWALRELRLGPGIPWLLRLAEQSDEIEILTGRKLFRAIELCVPPDIS